jgi:hypothetical protein
MVMSAVIRFSREEIPVPKINVTRLSPMRRGFLVGYRRAKARARKEMDALAADYDAELAALQHEFHQLAVARHRQCYDAAVDEAVIERSADPFRLLH